MTNQELYINFVKNNTKKRDGINANADFFRKYGNVSFEESFSVYMSNISSFIEMKNKINKFENYLISENATKIQSGISESRYYYYNGIKYRFSEHVYPTGSMTDSILGVVDFAAEPELINEIKL